MNFKSRAYAEKKVYSKNVQLTCDDVFNFCVTIQLFDRQELIQLIKTAALTLEQE
jgi:hypothetical protein